MRVNVAYVDRPEAGTVPGSHVLVEGLDGISTAEVTELLVHVVGSRPGVVAEPDSEVLDLQGLLLVDLRNRQTRPTRRVDDAQESCSQQSHSACLLRAARVIKDTYNVHTDNLAVGLLDLFELPA